MGDGQKLFINLWHYSLFCRFDTVRQQNLLIFIHSQKQSFFAHPVYAKNTDAMYEQYIRAVIAANVLISR